MAYGTIIKKRRRTMSLSYYSDGLPPIKHTAPRRGRIEGWTDGMATRLGAYIDNFREDFTGMLTLTYGDNAPRSGAVVKAQLRAFTERLRRQGYFEESSFVWFLEFQARGAPHLHLLTTGWIQKEWCAKAWAAITNGDERACTRVEALRASRSAGAYARKYARKSDQKTVPIGFLDVGRFWGCCGNKLNKDLVPRVPCVVAATRSVEPYKIFLKLKQILPATKVRVFDSPAGFVLYGDEAELNYLWRWLWENESAITSQRDPLLDGGMLLQLEESPGTRA